MCFQGTREDAVGLFARGCRTRRLSTLRKRFKRVADALVVALVLRLLLLRRWLLWLWRDAGILVSNLMYGVAYALLQP